MLVAVLFNGTGSATGAFRTDYFGIIKHMGVFIGPILILYFFHGLLTKHGHWLLFLFVKGEHYVARGSLVPRLHHLLLIKTFLNHRGVC